MNKYFYRRMQFSKNNFQGISTARPLTKVHVLILMNSQFKSIILYPIELEPNTSRSNQLSSLISQGVLNTCMSTNTSLLAIRLRLW